MSGIKSILNNTISKMVTRERVLKATQVEEIEFNAALMGYYETEQKKPGDDYDYDGVDAFIKDFCKEGWCKRELRDILDTLFHLNREIDSYAEYWF